MAMVMMTMTTMMIAIAMKSKVGEDGVGFQSQ